MSILSNLSLSNKINYNIDCSIIPILLSSLTNETLFKYLSKYIHIPDTYIEFLNNIENNMKTNNLGMLSLTIEYTNSKSNSKSNSNSINVSNNI